MNAPNIETTNAPTIELATAKSLNALSIENTNVPTIEPATAEGFNAPNIDATNAPTIEPATAESSNEYWNYKCSYYWTCHYRDYCMKYR